MQLTDDEKKTLNGERGDVLQRFMELLVGIGKAFDAPQLIPINSVHITSVSLATLREGGRHLIEDIADSGARFTVFTTVNPVALDCSQWRDLGVPEEEASKQFSVIDALRGMGAILCHTCTPYLIGNVPRFGEHIAWGEASAVIYANSVIGARTNPEGGPSGLASALLGKTPLYGLHLDENRVGQFVVRVKTELKEPTDYGALALWSGSIHKDLIPVFVGIPRQATWDGLKMLSATLHSVSSAKIFHAVGITPEARTEEQALGHRKPLDVIELGKRELDEAIHSLDKDTVPEVSWVTIGCPHCSIGEIRDVVRLLNGRKVNHNVSLWVCTSKPVKALADRMGLTEVLEKAGGKMVTECCPALCTSQTVRNLGFQSLTTNSTEMAFVMPKLHGIKVHCGRLKQCIDAAVSGKWR